MHFKIQVVIEEASGEMTIEDIIHLDKRCESGSTLGLSLLESKQLLQTLQKTMVLNQAERYSASHQDCPCCHKKRTIKSYHAFQFITFLKSFPYQMCAFITVPAPTHQRNHSVCYPNGYSSIPARSYCISRRNGPH